VSRRHRICGVTRVIDSSNGRKSSGRRGGNDTTGAACAVEALEVALVAHSATVMPLITVRLLSPLTPRPSPPGSHSRGIARRRKNDRDVEPSPQREKGLAGVRSAWTEHNLVFCDASGEPLSPTNETKRFQRVVAKPGLLGIRFHDLRHTATILLAKGVHVKLVSEMLGHSTIVLTLDTFSHVMPAMTGDAAAAMNAVFTA
jgi:integrase